MSKAYEREHAERAAEGQATELRDMRRKIKAGADALRKQVEALIALDPAARHSGGYDWIDHADFLTELSKIDGEDFVEDYDRLMEN